MTKIDDYSAQDRVSTIDDEKKRALDLWDMNLPVPAAGIFDEPTRCYKINKEWAAVIMGMVSWLAEIASWKAAQNESYPAIIEVLKFLQGDNCMDCTEVENCLDANPEYQALQTFVLELSISATQQHLDDLSQQYDGTAQSIDPLIPNVPPTTEEKNALCHAVDVFVKLYAVYKQNRILQASGFQVFWNSATAAARDFYNVTTNLLGFTSAPDLYQCVVAYSEAVTALQDSAAIDAVICCLYDSLKTQTIAEIILNNAIDSCVNSLTGNAQKIACLLQNDNNQQVYLSFLEAYSVSLQRQVRNDLFPPCQCEALQEMYIEYDFQYGDWGFVGIDGATYDPANGRWVGVGNGVDRTKCEIVKTFNAALPQPSIIAYAVDYERLNGIGGGLDTRIFSITDTGVEDGGVSTNFLPNGRFEQGQLVNDILADTIQFMCRAQNGTCCAYIYRVRIWVSSTSAVQGIPTDDIPASGTIQDYDF